MCRNKNALDADGFEELSAPYPRIETIAGPGALKNNALYLKSVREVVNDPDYPDLRRAHFTSSR